MLVAGVQAVRGSPWFVAHFRPGSLSPCAGLLLTGSQTTAVPSIASLFGPPRFERAKTRQGRYQVTALLRPSVWSLKRRGTQEHVVGFNLFFFFFNLRQNFLSRGEPLVIRHPLIQRLR